MQRDHAWHSARHLDDLERAAEIGRRAGERAVARLNPTRPKPGKYPVLFDPRVSVDACSAISPARSPARRSRARPASSRTSSASQVFAHGVTIVDDPLRLRGLRSRPFDGEGVRVVAPRAGRRTACSTAGSRKARRRGSSGSSRPAMPRAASAARPARRPSNLYMAAGHAQPRGTARGVSRSRAGHRADRAGRERGDRRLQPRRGRASWSATARSPSRSPRSPSPRT